jgi:hypothetical protein
MKPIKFVTSPYSTEDTICWQGTKDGNYTVKSGYNAIIDWESNNNEQGSSNLYSRHDTNWSKFWKLQNPPKQLHLIWRTLHNALPVKANLITRGIIVIPCVPDVTKARKQWIMYSSIVNGLKKSGSALP